VDACDELWLADNIGCWIQSCWNQVYSCAYQLTALSYFDGSGLAQTNDVPFYPPPSDASAGACSCNLGYVYGNLSAISTSTQGSNCEVIAGGDNKTLYDCECCELSWPISNILSTCPKSDLSGINFENGVSFPTYIQRIQTSLSPSPDKCAILTNNSTTCVSSYNFPYAGNSSYNPLSLPAGEPGTQPLSNTAGDPFTAFPSDVNLTLTLKPSYTSTITPASFNTASASANPQSIAGTSIYGGTTTSSTSVLTTSTSAPVSTSASAAATTSKKSDGFRVEGNAVLVSFAVVLTVVRIL